jgi:hypothetical protein
MADVVNIGTREVEEKEADGEQDRRCRGEAASRNPPGTWLLNIEPSSSMSKFKKEKQVG